MLNLAMEFLTGELNGYLAARGGASTVEVKPSRMVNDQGRYAFPAGSVGLTLINVEEERAVRAQLPERVLTNGQERVRQPELKLNLSVLFAANFTLYEEALKYLSHILLFFQSHPSFTRAEHPALDARIEKLVVELQSLNYEQLNQIWGFVGGKQLPSAVYRVRMVVLQDTAPMAIQPPITTISAEIRAR